MKQRVCDGIPRNGIALYTDGVSLNEFIPRGKIPHFFYRCGDEYITYCEDKQTSFAIISIDNTEAGIAVVQDNSITMFIECSSGVGGKSGKGGQSQRRYERNRNRELNDYYKRVAEHCKLLLEHTIALLVVSGPSLTKHNLLPLLHYRLRELPLQIIDIEYAGHTGVYQTINRMTCN